MINLTIVIFFRQNKPTFAVVLGIEQLTLKAMETTKNLFENWAETQKKMFETWSHQAEEFQKNLLDGKAIEKGKEIYDDLLKKQQEGIKAFTKTATKVGESIGAAGINPFENFFGQWKNIQDKTAELWTDSTKKMNDFFSGITDNITHDGHAGSVFENARKYQETWANALKSMTGAMKMPFEGTAADFTTSTAADAYKAMQKGTESFMKLFELWSPVFKAAQNNVFSTDQYKKIMNPVLYKELMDKLFNFDSLSPLKQSYDQFMSTVNNWYGNLSGSAKENYESFKKSLDEFSNTLPKNQEFFADIFKNINAQYKNSVSPFFKLMPESREKEQMMLVNELGDFYMDSANKMAKLQYLVYLQGVKVNEKILEDLSKKAENGTMYTDFTEFYNNWVKLNSKDFENMFRTDEFSKLQGELVTLDAQIRSTTDKLMEKWLEPYPVVLKSHLDEIYKTNYDLKKQVYELGKQLTALQKQALQKVTEVKTSKTTTPVAKAEKPVAGKKK
jgi:polyhydroxyalkanoate synthase subunit PhaE